MKPKPLILLFSLVLLVLGVNACVCNPQKPFTTGTRGAAANAPVHDAAYENHVRQTIDRLYTLEMEKDQDSLNAILAELRNPDERIRAAALEATIQFGDRSVIPKLQEIAEQTADPAEQSAIFKAIDYLKLPSFSEYLAEKRALEAAGQTNTPSVSPSVTNIPQPAPGQP